MSSTPTTKCTDSIARSVGTVTISTAARTSRTAPVKAVSRSLPIGPASSPATTREAWLVTVSLWLWLVIGDIHSVDGLAVRGGFGQSRGPPVPFAEQPCRGGYEQGADEEGVQHDGEGDGEAELACLGVVAGHCEHAEGAGKDQSCGGDRAAGAGEGAGQGVTQRMRLGFFSYPAHQQDVVVLAESHGEDEQQDRDDEVDAGVPADVHEHDSREAECGQVGQADRGDQVQRGDQAAQQGGEQDCEDQEHEWGEGYQVVGGG